MKRTIAWLLLIILLGIFWYNVGYYANRFYHSFGPKMAAEVSFRYTPTLK